MAGEVLDLDGLLVDDGRGFGEVGIDELLVGLVDQWGEEEDGGSNKRHAPEWNNLDEVVGEEGTNESLWICQMGRLSDSMWQTYSSGDEQVLGEDDLLGLNDEEVDELVDISNQRVQCLLGNSVVLLGANLGSETGGEESLSNSFSQNSDTQNDVCKLEAVSDDIEVSGREDEEDGCKVRNAGGAGMLP